MTGSLIGFSYRATPQTSTSSDPQVKTNVRRRWCPRPRVPTDDNSLVDSSSCVGKTFVTGIAKQYSTEYDADHPLMRDCLPREVFVECVRALNHTLRSFWPCALVWYFGYVAALPTLGLSLYAP